LVIAVAASAGMVAAALSGAALPTSGVQFQPTGHWVYNTASQAAFHVDGGTTNVDARVPVAGEPGSQVVQGDTNGYVVSPNRITTFGKSNLKVLSSVVPPANETPLAIEAVGGPYLIYRQAGKIVRLGDSATVIPIGDKIGDPVVTTDGTLWLLRQQSGLVCSLPSTATQTSACPAKIPSGHTGALTTVADKPRILDTSAGILHAINSNGLGTGKPVGVPTSASTRIAPTDSNGRIVLLNPDRHTLSFVDTQSNQRPINVPLGKGDYEGPLWTGTTAAVVNSTTGTLQTYDSQGHPQENKKIPASEGQPSMSRGADGRVYVQNGAGSQLLVVGKDGKVSDAPVTGAPDPTGSPSPNPSQPPPSQEPRPHPSDTTPQPPPDTRQPNPDPVTKPTQPSLPASPPGAPRSVSASGGNKTVTVSWAAATANRAAVTGYVVSWSGGSRTVSGSVRKTTVTGLTNGQSYVFSVTARNSAGQGPAASTNAATPIATASAPRSVSASKSGNTVTVSWGQPDLGGGTLQHYTVSATGQSGKTVTGTSTTYSGLPAGSYTFTVRAVTTAAGRTMTGAAASDSLTIVVKTPKIDIERRQESGAPNCDTCFYLYMTITGFPPNYKFKAHVIASGSEYGSPCSRTTDSQGDAICDDDTNDNITKGEIHVYVDLPTGERITSNSVTWN
jgi:hypothetical protein